MCAALHVAEVLEGDDLVVDKVRVINFHLSAEANGTLAHQGIKLVVDLKGVRPTGLHERAIGTGVQKADLIAAQLQNTVATGDHGVADHHIAS